MKSMEEVLQKLELLMADVGKPQMFISDGAWEFKSGEISDLCRKKGNQEEFSALYTRREYGQIESVCGTVTGTA